MEEPGQLKRAFIDSLAGALAGGISRTVTSPLDVIKIRFQVQLEPTSSWALLQRDMYRPSKYTGILQASKDIFREEGLAGFWRGNVPALLMYMPYTAIQFTVLHKLKTFAAGSSRSEDHLQLSPYLSYGEPKIYPNMRSAFFDIIQTRGIRGLYAGLTPTLVEIIPYAGLQFGSYDTFKRWMMAWNRYRNSKLGLYEEDNSASSFQLFLCGFAAGTCAKAVCHPLDVVKKRFQIEGLQRHPKYGARIENQTYKSMLHAFREIVAKEGFAGLYKGIFPSLVKSAPAGAVTFVAYEYISDWLESILT
uniref:Mitochondrial thiamine diphosphate carrier 2-like n=1 Tax=Ananas comosus var. bracteatus TaxID=296719 RepID=A0A6V7PCV1_ANACO|nr:unnamed protein product [Ananas comosus var. bracteatus]